MHDDELIIQLPATTTSAIIKVIGVGGGGNNAVANMYREHIEGVRYLVCNTDKKQLDDSPVPDRMQIGNDGLGVGGVPTKGRKMAEESLEQIASIFDKDTKMVFITAGMGGGTGTGAGPVIAREAKQRGLLTVGIVTIPFLFEGKYRIDLALDGVEQMARNVDALLVVNNERLRQIYADLSVANAFRKADDTLTKAVRTITEMITMHGRQHLDFCDVDTCLRGGGVALMSYGFGQGEGRVTKAIEEALHSPLLNDNNIYRSRKLCMLITSPGAQDAHPLMTEELSEVNAFMARFNEDVETKYGWKEDEEQTDVVKVTILASGFSLTPSEEIAFEVNGQDMNQTEREKRDTRITQWYCSDKNISKNRKRHPRIFIFNPTDMDNPDLINLVQDTPTCQRSDRELRNLQELQRYSTSN